VVWRLTSSSMPLDTWMFRVRDWRRKSENDMP
jgi:hypothetical protein